jgi:hypothetical protein
MWAVVTYRFDQYGQPSLEAVYPGFSKRVSAWNWAHANGLVDYPDEPGKWEDIRFSFDIVEQKSIGSGVIVCTKGTKAKARQNLQVPNINVDPLCLTCPGL